MKPAEFADLFSADPARSKLSSTDCPTMDEVWATAQPEWVVWIATRPGVLDDRTLRLFSVLSARHLQHVMRDPRSISALEVADRNANGQATDAELAAAYEAEKVAAWNAAWNAAGAAARTASWSAQAAWLRANAKPDWERARMKGGAR